MKALGGVCLKIRIMRVVGLLACAAPAFAFGQTVATIPEPQSADNANANSQIQEVVVTARLRSESLTQAPVLVTAVTGSTLDSQGVSDLTGLGQLVPTVNISTSVHADAIHVRGIGTSTTNAGFEQQAPPFIDGIYYGTGHWISGAYVDLDQIQVLEGPQGVYFGKNTIAGAIQLTTKNPGDQFEAYVKSGYEFNAEERYVQGVVSTPITDTLGVRVAVRSSAMQGWARSPEGTGEPGESDTYARLTLAWKPTSNFDATIKASIDQFDNNGPQALATLISCGGPNNTPSPLSLFALFGVANSGGRAECARNYNTSTGQYTAEGTSYEHNPSYTVTANANWRNDYGTLTSITGLNRFALSTLGQYGGSSYDAIDGLNGTRDQVVSTELRYQTKLDFPVNFLGGVYYQSSAFFNYEEPDLIPMASQGQPFSWTRGSTQHGESKALFGEIQWTPIDTVELDFSGRYTDESKDFNFNQFDTAPIIQQFGIATNGIISSNTENYNFSPQFTATWRPTRDFMTYVAYKTGFLAGGFEHTATLNAASTVRDFVYGPEKVQGGEIGTKFFLLDRHVQLNATAYYYDYTGLQVNTYDPSTTAFFTQNAGDSIDKGIEVSGVWRIGDGFQLSSSLAYNKSYFEQFVGACLANATFTTGCNVPTSTAGVYQQDFQGTHTDYAPTWVGRIAGSWSREFAGDTTVHAGVGLDFSDKYLEAQYAVQPGYIKVDANISVIHGPWEAALIGQNLTNQFVCGSVLGRPLATVPSELLCLVDRGMEIRTEATYHF